TDAAAAGDADRPGADRRRRHGRAHLTLASAPRRTACYCPPPMADGQHLLEVKDLVTEFRTEHGTVRAVDRVSFEVPPGKTLGVVGESGCGKSVTALSIMRLIPNPPGRIAGGSIRYRGTNL